MAKLEFATENDFRQHAREQARARRVIRSGIQAEYRKHHKILNNDFQHLYSTGMPFGGGR